MASRILIVDDEPNIIATVAALLRARGYDVVSAGTGREALAAVGREALDLVVLDLGLPDIEGVEVCRQVRLTSSLPVLVLSARGAEGDKVRALDAGADDYVTKPFGTEELLARIRAHLGRVDAPSPPGEPMVRGDLVIDRERFRVVRSGEAVRLTPKEFELLVLLAQHPGRVLTHRAILKAMWGPNAVDQPEHLRVLVASLRKKSRQPRRVRRTSSPSHGSGTDSRMPADAALLRGDVEYLGEVFFRRHGGGRNRNRDGKAP